jgi:hypothetical protein
MSFAKDSSDMDDYMLRDAPITLRLEKIKGHENIIGVCIHDKCLYDKQLEKLSGSQASQQELIEFKEKATNKFIEFELYLRQEFVPDIVSIKASDDKTKQEKILTKFRSELNSMFVAMPETQGIVSTIVFEFDPSNKEITKAALYVNGIKVKEGTVLSMPFPYGSDNKQYEKNIVITNFEGGKVTLSDGSTKIINAIPHGTKLIKTLKFE